MEAGAQPSELVDVTTTAALEEKAKLRRHFGRFDILFFLICTIVGLDTLGAVASNGAAGLHLAHLPLRPLLHPVRAAHGRARRRVPGGGRLLRVDEARVRTVRGRRQLGRLLALEPDLARRRARDHRAHDLLDLLHRHLGHERPVAVRLPARLHLVRGVGRDPLVQRRQVDPVDRRVRAGDPARVLLPVRPDLRDQARRARLRRGRLQAVLRRVHRGRPGSLLQPRRLRAAERGRRGDDERAAGRPVHDPPRRRPLDHPLRRPRADDPARPADRPGHEPRRLHRRDEDRLHGLRRLGLGRRDGDPDRRRARARRHRRARLHLGADVERRDLDHRRRPHPGGLGLRRRRAARPRRLLEAVRHADRRQPPLGRRRDARHGARLGAHVGELGEVLQRRARARDLDDGRSPTSRSSRRS